MDLNLIDKLSLDNLVELENRNHAFRIVINHKIYDTSHEDDIARYVIQHTKFKDMLLIRYEYYLSKSYHGLGKGDMVFYDKQNDMLYAVELKSLKDKYSSITDNAKIEKCIAQSIKYSEYTSTWASKKSIAIAIIEFTNGTIQITETTSSEKVTENVLDDEIMSTNQPVEQIPKIKSYPWTNTIYKKELEEINNDQWFSHPGDQTLTKYRIVGDTLESERIVDYQPSSGSRKAFRKRVRRVCQEATNCNKYLCILKDTQGTILMQEYHEINETETFDD